jgi:hypothetical protein
MAKMELVPASEQPDDVKKAVAEASPVDDPTLVAETYANYDKYRALRRPYEVQWYINASALRGFPDVRWNADANRLETKREPAPVSYTHLTLPTKLL